MNYGLYLSAAGVLTNMHRQDVAANNLANVETVGFKRDLATFIQRDAESIEDRLDPDVAHALLDRLGGGVHLGATRLDRSQGPLKTTDNPLDVAIEGRGFFVVNAQVNGESHPRLTRDGRLTMAPDGTLVMNNGRHPVLDMNDQPIVLDPAQSVEIDELGQVKQNDAVVGRLALLDVADGGALKHLGMGLYQASDAAMSNRTVAPGLVRQGALESSNIDPVREMLTMIEASRAITLSGNLMRYHDLTMDRAANVLGRVA